jgi:hypothetical protein
MGMRVARTVPLAELHQAHLQKDAGVREAARQFQVLLVSARVRHFAAAGWRQRQNRVRTVGPRERRHHAGHLLRLFAGLASGRSREVAKSLLRVILAHGRHIKASKKGSFGCP